jgi:hypothetical protein
MKVVAICLINVNKFESSAKDSCSLVSKNCKKVEAIGKIAHYFGVDVEDLAAGIFACIFGQSPEIVKRKTNSLIEMMEN